MLLRNYFLVFKHLIFFKKIFSPLPEEDSQVEIYCKKFLNKNFETILFLFFKNFLFRLVAVLVPDMEFKNAFNKFCDYFSKYGSELRNLTGQKIGAFKSSKSIEWKELYVLLKEKVPEFTDLSTKNFFDCSVLLFQHFDENEISINPDFYKESTNDVIFQFLSLLLIEDLKIDNNSLSDEKIEILFEIQNKFLAVFNNRIKSKYMNSSLKNLIIQNQFVSNNQSILQGFLDCSVDKKLETLSKKFQSNMDMLADKINNVNYVAKVHNLYNKKLRFEHHQKIFETHLNNKTTPRTLNHTNFPIPFLQDDEKWINSYNELIEKIQVQILEFNQKMINDRISELNEEIGQIKIKMQNNSDYNDLNIEKLFEDIKIEKENKLLKYFNRKDEQLKRLTVSKFTVRDLKNNRNIKNKNNKKEQFYKDKNQINFSNSNLSLSSNSSLYSDSSNIKPQSILRKPYQKSHSRSQYKNVNNKKETNSNIPKNKISEEKAVHSNSNSNNRNKNKTFNNKKVNFQRRNFSSKKS